MNVITLLLLIAAGVCFVLGALRVSTRFEPVAAGLLLWLLAAALLPALATL